MKTKTPKAPKVDPAWVQDPSQWGVKKYGIQLYINPETRCFPDGVSLDVEDDEQGGFVGIGICDGTACYWWSEWELAKTLTIPKFIAHNGRTDLSKLQKWGFKIDESWLLWDTQLMAHILDSSKKRYGLKALVIDLGINYPTYEDLTGKKISGKNPYKALAEALGTHVPIRNTHKTLKDLDSILVAEYNAMDCLATYKLYESQTKGQRDIQTSPLETPETQYFNQIEKPISFIFHAMESRGIRVDLPYLQGVKESLEAQKKPLEASILNELGDINLNSPKQLLEALNAKGINPQFKGKPSTDKRALGVCKDHPIIGSLLSYSELDTLLTSFVYPYLERNTEVVHPQFNQCGTRTGRLSCSNPNLLQIPRRTENGKLVRQVFVAREGCLLGDCDFGQIEPRVLAHLSRDKAMLEMFNGGTDFHTFTSERLKVTRDIAKVLNLSVGYRATYKSVSQQLKCSWDQAQKEIDAWWAMFPGLYDWEQQLIHESKKSGYFTTLMGRRIKVEDLDHGNSWRREAAERQLINNITQGSAAEIMKKAMIGVSLENIDILVQVYDELLIEECEDGIQEAMFKTIDIMTHCVKLNVPLTVDAGIGRSWNEAK